MHPDPIPISGRLVLADSGVGLLCLSRNGRNVRVELAWHIANVMRCLFEHHSRFESVDARQVGAYISAKDLAQAAGLRLHHQYDVKSYVFRARRLIQLASQEAGATGEFTTFIRSRNGWGYALAPDAIVALEHTHAQIANEAARVSSANG